MRRLVICSCFALGLVAAPGALAAGGPVPPVQGGAGVGGPGADVTYVAVGAGRGTVVERVRRGSGFVERSAYLPESLGVPGVAYDGSDTGLSADGRRLVLARTFRRYPIKRTSLVVLDARPLRVRERVTLPGWYTVDGISPTGRWLYLIHYTSTRDSTRYEVRAYDLPARHMVARPVVDPREPDEAMRGVPVTRTTSADGRWAYTLYQRPTGAPFIHALDTQGRTARCIDLPAGLGNDIAAARLALADGGATLRVQGETETLALVDTRTWAAREPTAKPQPASRPPAHRAATAQDDGGNGTPWALVAAGLAALAAIAAGVTLRRRRTSTPA